MYYRNVSTRGPYAVGRRRREKIIEVALELIEEQGYYQTSMLDVAQKVGISEGGLLHHFPSKQHLILAVAQQRFERDIEWWESLPEDVTGFEIFEHMVQSTARGAQHPTLVQLGAILTAEAADTSGLAHSLFQERYAAAIEDLAGRLKRGLEPEGFNQVDWTEIARDCLAFSDGVHLHYVISGGQVDLESAVRRHVERIKNSIRATRGTP